LVLSKKCRRDICVAVPGPEIHGDASPVRRELMSEWPVQLGVDG